MNKKILVIVGHPRRDSYCGVLARAYAEAAKESNTEVKELYVGEMHFNPVATKGFEHLPELEPDTLQAQQDIQWSDHLVFVYPIWWGTIPALLKGFIERVFLPGFAYEYREDSPWWDKLLAGRTARLIVTMDSPPLYYRWVFKKPGHSTMKNTILEFCGIKPVHITEFGPMRTSSQKKRERWLVRAREIGKRLE